MLTFTILSSYFLLLLCLGAWASRHGSDLADVVVARRRVSPLGLVFLLTGATLSGMTVLGVAEVGYRSGWPTIWESLSVPLGLVVCLLVLGRRLRRADGGAGDLTVQDYLARRYDSPRTLRGIAAIVGIIVCFFYLIAQYHVCMVVLGRILGIPPRAALATTALIAMSYVTMGGLSAIRRTSAVQAVILLVGAVVIAAFVLKAAGGLGQVNDVLRGEVARGGLEPGFVGLSYPQTHPPDPGYAVFTPLYLVSFCVMLVFGIATAPHVISSVYATAGNRRFLPAAIGAFAASAVVLVGFKLVGLAAKSMEIAGTLRVGSPREVLIDASLHSLPGWLTALPALIALAAVMSTSDRLLLTLGSYFSLDVYKTWLRPAARDRELTLVIRVAVVAAACGSVLLAAWHAQALSWLVWQALGMALAGLAAPLLGGLYWRRATRAGAVAATVVGFGAAVALVVAERCGAVFPVRCSFLAFALSCLTLVVVSLFTRCTGSR